MTMIDNAVKGKAQAIKAETKPDAKRAAKDRLDAANNAVIEMRARHKKAIMDQADERRRLERELTEAHRAFHGIN